MGCTLRNCANVVLTALSEVFLYMVKYTAQLGERRTSLAIRVFCVWGTLRFFLFQILL